MEAFCEQEIDHVYYFESLLMMSNKEIACGSVELANKYKDLANELRINSEDLQTEEKAAASMNLVKGSIDLAFSVWSGVEVPLLKALEYFDSGLEKKDLQVYHLTTWKPVNSLTVLKFPFIGCSYIGGMDWKAVKALKYLMFFGLMVPTEYDCYELFELIQRYLHKYVGVRDIDAMVSLRAAFKELV